MKVGSTVTQARLVNFSSEDSDEGSWKVLNRAVIPLATSQLSSPPPVIIEKELPLGLLRALSAVLEKQNGSGPNLELTSAAIAQDDHGQNSPHPVLQRIQALENADVRSTVLLPFLRAYYICSFASRKSGPARRLFDVPGYTCSRAQQAIRQVIFKIGGPVRRLIMEDTPATVDLVDVFVVRQRHTGPDLVAWVTWAEAQLRGAFNTHIRSEENMSDIEKMLRML
ncbi:MAG: hypothetical protein Q9183_000699 [Haloplaca sp. 2 TL-2023]